MKMFNFNKEQEAVLVQLLTDAGRKLTQIQFNDPDNDHRDLRQHAFIKGQFDLLRTLLADEFEAPQPATTES